MRQPNKTSAFTKLKQLGVPVQTVIDVGVYHGTPELMKAYPSAEHILCEPLEECHSIIKAKYRAAGIKYILWASAISDFDGTSKLQISSVFGKQPTHSTVNEAGEREISVCKLDSIWAPLDRYYPTPYLLKVDVDGNELGVLGGATETLQQCSVLVVEAVLTRFHEVYEACVAQNFKLFDVVDLCYHDDRLSQVDLVFLRQDVYESLPNVVFDIRKWQPHAH